MQTQWITFDCFGTLVDWQTGFSNILTPVFGDRTAAVPRAYHTFERGVQRERPHRLYQEVLTSALLRAARQTGVSLSAVEARRLPQLWASQPLYDDVEPMLAGLRAMGSRLAVLTNCDEDLFARTHRCFHQPFDLVITAEQVQDYKPSLAHFHTFQQISEAAPDHWIHVACSWYHDIVPSQALGIKWIWLDRDATGEDAGASPARARSASEVVPHVKKLFGKAV